MKFKNLIYIHSALCLTLLAAPAHLYAQTDDLDEGQQPAKARTEVPRQKQYATRIVKGRVLDATNKHPLAGIIVHADGIDGYSVLTGDDGSFELKVPVFATAIYVTGPDYNAIRMGLAKGEQQRDIRLYPQTFSADAHDKNNVRSDEATNRLEYSNAINVKEEIQKQLGAYAYTVTRNGAPGIGATVFLQGLNSLNANAQPLVVIDGVPIDQQYGRTMLHEGFYNDILSNLNPADIANITVMRNGTALYGAQGANGVILIETRRSKSLATRITATISAGVVAKPRLLSVMDASQYRGYASELLKSTNTRITNFKFLNEDPNYYYYNQYHNNTDWKKDVYRNALTQNYGINVEGGDAVATYNLSVGYTSAQSTLKCNDLSRLNIRFNTDILLTDRFSARFDASFTNLTRNIRNDAAPTQYNEGTPTSPAFLAYVKSPFLSPYTYSRGLLSDSHLDIEDETYLDEALARYSNYNYKLANPLALNAYGEAKNKNRFENSMLNLSVTPKFQINPHLFVSEHFSYNLVNTNEKFYIPISGVPDYFVSSVNAYRSNEVRSLFSKQNSVFSDTRVDWNNRYDAHALHVFGGVRVNWESYTLSNQLGYNTGSDKTPFMSSSLLNSQAKGSNDDWNSISWYAQADYNYKERYFLQGNLTAQGSSRFGRDAKGLHLFDAAWGVFPGMQAAWVMTNESWMARQKVLDYLRLSAGYEVSGNDDVDYKAARSYLSSVLFLNDISGLVIDGIGNNAIQWETTRRANLGLETHLLNHRLGLSFNVFKSWTNHLLTSQSLGFLSGLKENWTNDGKLENTGFDVSARIKLLARKSWQWEVGASIGHYKNKVTALAAGVDHIDQNIGGATIRTQVGRAANVFYGYKTAGVFSTTEEAKAAALYILGKNGVDRTYFGAGDMKFVDTDGNHEINDKDRVVIGDPNPDIYGNIYTTLSWKRFKLDAHFNYSVGNDVFNYQRAQLESGSRFMNQTTVMVNRWQIEGQQTNIPKITFQDPMGNARFSDRWIEDGSYLRLKSVTLSYDLPLHSQYLQGLQFWIQANNMFTVTKYLGSDPEFSSTSSVLGQGIDMGSLGQSRSFVLGMKINL